MSDADVIVVGASVAGAATALHLARAGHTVLVLDKASFPRDKPCGEGILPRGVEELERLGLGTDVGKIGRRFFGAAYISGDRRAEGRFPRGYGLAVRRLHLDDLLARTIAAEPRVVRRLGVRVDTVQVDAGGVAVETPDGRFTARAIVGADGLFSGVRRQLGLTAPGHGPARYGARLHVKVEDLRSIPDVVEVYVGPRLEFYLTPLPHGVVNLAVLCGKDTSRTFGGDLEGSLRRLAAGVPGVARWLDVGTTLSEARLTGPLRQVAKSLVADRAVLVGDAAGFIDAITGEGMSLALASARLAAETLDAALRRDRLAAADLRPYEDRRRAMSRDPSLLTEVVLWWLRHPRLARYVVGNLSRHPETFGRMMAVNAGQAPLLSVGPRDWARIVVGRG